MRKIGLIKVVKIGEDCDLHSSGSQGGLTGRPCLLMRSKIDVMTVMTLSS